MTQCTALYVQSLRKIHPLIFIGVVRFSSHRLALFKENVLINFQPLAPVQA